MTYTFIATAFVLPNFVNAEGEYNDNARKLFAEIRSATPELRGWADAAIGGAWGSFSLGGWGVGWVDECLPIHLESFLAYIYVSTEVPDFDFGSSANYIDELLSLQKDKPWLTNDTLPAWTQCRGSSHNLITKE
jgi:hypothetical protein